MTHFYYVETDNQNLRLTKMAVLRPFLANFPPFTSNQINKHAKTQKTQKSQLTLNTQMRSFLQNQKTWKRKYLRFVS